MKTFKSIFGIILLLVGIFLILGGLYKSYFIFTGKVQPPEIFQYQKELSKNQILNRQSKEKATLSPEEIQNLIQEQLQELIPQNVVPKVLNLIAWSIFMGILFLGAGKISWLGINLLR